MKVQCINKECKTIFEVNVDRLPVAGPKKLRCAYCKTVFYVERPPEPGKNSEETDTDHTMLLNLANRNREHDPPSFEQFALQKQASRRFAVLPVTNPEPLVSELTALKESSVSLPGADNSFLSELRAGVEASTASRSSEISQPGGPPTQPVFQKVTVSLERKAEMLVQTEWLPELTAEQCLEFAQYWEVFFGRARSPLFKPGDRNSFVCLIYAGEIGLYRSTEEVHQKCRPLMQLGKGVSLGEQAIFRIYSRSLLALLETDCYLLLLTRKQSRDMAQNHPQVWQCMVNKLLTQLADMVSQQVGAEQLEVFSEVNKALISRKP